MPKTSMAIWMPSLVLVKHGQRRFPVVEQDRLGTSISSRRGLQAEVASAPTMTCIKGRGRETVRNIDGDAQHLRRTGLRWRTPAG